MEVMSQVLRIDDTAVKDIPVLICIGECDVYSAPKLKHRLADLIEAGHKNIIIDLQGVSFMDSTGLGILVGAYKRINGHPAETGDGMIYLVAKGRVVKSLNITGLIKVFKTFIVGELEDFEVNETTIDNVLKGKRT